MSKKAGNKGHRWTSCGRDRRNREWEKENRRKGMCEGLKTQKDREGNIKEKSKHVGWSKH